MFWFKLLPTQRTRVLFYCFGKPYLPDTNKQDTQSYSHTFISILLERGYSLKFNMHIGAISCFPLLCRRESENSAPNTKYRFSSCRLPEMTTMTMHQLLVVTKTARVPLLEVATELDDGFVDNYSNLVVHNQRAMSMTNTRSVRNESSTLFPVTFNKSTG